MRTDDRAASAEVPRAPGARQARQAGRLRAAFWREVAGLGSVVAMAVAYLSPALKDGARFGPFDFVLQVTPLGAGAYPYPPFNHLDSDVVSQMNAWNLVDWTQLHAGHFPLWNDLSLLGLPHFLNFESAVLSLPDLVSYAVPLAYAFFVAVLVKLLIAGLGAYVLGRVLGLRPLGASFAGVSFMLSGAFANWLSWPLSDVVAWLGWILAFGVLTYRHYERARYATGLAVSVAFCLYGGFPEANVFVAVAVAVLLVAFVVAAAVARRSERLGRRPARSVAAGLATVAGGSVAGGLLSLPLWWPGLQVLHLAHRTTEGGFPGIPVRGLALFVAQGYDGLPTASNPFFLTGWNYYETAVYVGVVMLVLAFVAAVVLRRHPTIVALVVLCLVVVVVCYELPSFHPVQSVLNHLAGQVFWARFRSVVGLPLGLLGGAGLEIVARRARSRAAFLSFVAATVVMAAAVALLASRTVAGAAAAAVRHRSLIWPAGLVVLCAGVAAAWFVVTRSEHGQRRRPSRAPRRRVRVLGAALWAGNAGFLLFAGVGINGYSHSLYPVTPAIAELQHDVGHALVGLDDGNGTNVTALSPVGFYPNVNLGYGIAQFTGHDPVLPQSYFVAFAGRKASGGPGFFEPDVSSVALARRYGTPFILARAGLPPVAGARLVAVIAGERLYAVPGVARFSVPAASGKVVATSHPSPSEYDLTTSTTSPTRLTARVTAVPGWHATIDGRPVSLVKTNGVMWSLSVPSGHHTIRLWYLPNRLVQGIAAAALGAAALSGYGLWRALSRRKRAGQAAHRSAGSSGRDGSRPGARRPDPFSLARELERLGRDRSAAFDSRGVGPR